MADWLLPADVASYAQIDDVTGDDALTDATAAVVAFVERHLPEYQTGTASGYAPPADVKLGAQMLAARLYERRGTLLGVAGFSDFSGSSPLLRQDPDIARLLRLGQHSKFSFGAPSS